MQVLMLLLSFSSFFSVRSSLPSLTYAFSRLCPLQEHKIKAVLRLIETYLDSAPSAPAGEDANSAAAASLGRTLVLASMGVEDSEATLLAQALQKAEQAGHSPAVAEIDLSGNRITGTGRKAGRDCVGLLLSHLTVCNNCRLLFENRNSLLVPLYLRHRCRSSAGGVPTVSAVRSAAACRSAV